MNGDHLPFERSVFLNCPFDPEFASLLQTISFCIADLDFHPRLAPEDADNAAARLDRIADLIRGSKFGIHDLGRCRATAAGDYARFNMPFELRLDHACARFGPDYPQSKSILILERDRFDYRMALSDIAGWDIQAHGGEFIRVVRIVRDWLVRRAGATPKGASKIIGDYATFQGWYWAREHAHGASDDDIRAYPTYDLVIAKGEWIEAGRPD